MLHVSDDSGEGLRRSVMIIGRQRLEAQERGDIEPDAMAIAIIVDSQSVLCSLQRVRDDGGSGLFVGPDVVAEQVPLPRHAKVEGADVAQESVQVLSADGVAGERAGPLGEDFSSCRWRR